MKVAFAVTAEQAQVIAGWLLRAWKSGVEVGQSVAELGPERRP